MNVGIIGVGLMGHGIARNVLIRGRFPLVFLDHPGNQPVDDLVGEEEPVGGERRLRAPACVSHDRIDLRVEERLAAHHADMEGPQPVQRIDPRLERLERHGW